VMSETELREFLGEQGAGARCNGRGSVDSK